MSGRRGRRRERGSQSLELVAVLPLLAVVMATACQTVAVVREQAEAEADARALARAEAMCPHPTSPPGDPRSVDPAGADGAVTTTLGGGPPATVTVRVELPVRSLVPHVALPARLDPVATVTLRMEPCASGA